MNVLVGVCSLEACAHPKEIEAGRRQGNHIASCSISERLAI